jgi:hypothetical protein
MNAVKRKISSIAGTNWQVLGELELIAGSNTDPTVGKWLAVILSRLDLRPDFLDKVLKSAQEAASRAMQAEAVRKFDHLHLVVFAPTDHTSNNYNWGFYRIEKVEKVAGKSNPDHMIEFYLYQE